jgi:hypothetical protein
MKWGGVRQVPGTGACRPLVIALGAKRPLQWRAPIMATPKALKASAASGPLRGCIATAAAPHTAAARLKRALSALGSIAPLALDVHRGFGPLWEGARASNGSDREDVPVCALPRAGLPLLALRSGQRVLRPGVFAGRAPAFVARGRCALPEQPSRALCARPAGAPLPGPPRNSDASG